MGFPLSILPGHKNLRRFRTGNRSIFRFEPIEPINFYSRTDKKKKNIFGKEKFLLKKKYLNYLFIFYFLKEIY